MPRRDGPSVVAVGIGDPAALDAGRLRDAAAAFARAAAKHGARWRRRWPTSPPSAPDVAGQAVVEGILLARYRYGALKRESPATGADATSRSSPAPAGPRRSSGAPSAAA